MTLRTLLGLLCLYVAANGPVAVLAQKQATPIIPANTSPNTPEQQKKHYVVLVSLDGFRYDYVTNHGATHLAALAKSGATAPDGMLPSYPSITFPNHLSLVTGLYPEHHGIVANTFYDPSRKETYIYKLSKINSDGTWYTGTPLWSLAEKQGMRAASFFWPGSEALIAGERPDEYMAFDDKFDDEKRLDQVIAWLSEPEAQRPHLITLYYSNTDHAGHDFGPESDEARKQVQHVDALMGELREKLDATKLPVDLVVVADHGMARVEGDWITLDKYADLTHFHTEGSLLYAESEADAAKAYASFHEHADPRFTVYRRAEMPPYLRFNENAREGDPVIVANGPYMFRAHESAKKIEMGEHGYDPVRMWQMRALFVANGPDIVPGTKLDTFKNVDVYNFVAALLGLTPAPNDGELAPLAKALKANP